MSRAALLLAAVGLVAVLLGAAASADGGGSGPAPTVPVRTVPGPSTTASAAVSPATTPITTPVTVASTTTTPGATTPVTAPASPTTTIPVPASAPASVAIESIGVSSSLIDLDLAADGTLEVPGDFALAGWFTRRATPGAPGPLVIVGHVDSHSGPAVFHRLPELVAGDEVAVAREDGRVARYRVTDVQQHPKDGFPTNLVYDWTDESTIRLITCGGDFDRAARSYLDNVIVFGDLIDVT